MRVARRAGTAAPAGSDDGQRGHGGQCGQRVGRFQAVQQSFRRSARGPRRPGTATTKPSPTRHDGLADEKPRHAPRLGAERHPDADLPRPARDRVRHHAIQADHGQQRRQHAEHAGQTRNDALVGHRTIRPAVPSSPSGRSADSASMLAHRSSHGLEHRRRRPGRCARRTLSDRGASVSRTGKNSCGSASSRMPMYFDVPTTPTIWMASVCQGRRQSRRGGRSGRPRRSTARRTCGWRSRTRNSRPDLPAPQCARAR